MKVMICVNVLNYAMGGVSTHILDLCRQYALNDEIEQVTVCCDGGEHIEALRQIPKTTYAEVPFDHYPMNAKGVLSAYRDLAKVVRSSRPDIIHVHSQRVIPPVHLIKLRYRIPYLWTNHIDAIPGPETFRKMCRLLKFPIISVSIELKNMMVRDYGYDPEKVFVVNNGTDLDQLTPLSDEERAQLEEKYHIDRSRTPYVIALLSRIHPAKGHRCLLEAISGLEEKDRIQLLIAGKTYDAELSYRRSLEQYCEIHGIHAEFLDFSRPRDVFGVADLFCLPSLFEGFALTCIEAMAMGCAVIRSRTPGWQEMEDYVEVVEKKDVAGLRTAIHEAIENDFNREKTLAGQKAVFGRFTKQRCAEETIEVYRKLL